MPVDIPDLANKLDELFRIKQREKAEDNKALSEVRNALAKENDEATKKELRARYDALRERISNHVTSRGQLASAIPVVDGTLHNWIKTNRIPANRIPILEKIFEIALFNKVCGITEAERNRTDDLNRNNPFIFYIPVPHNPFFTGRLGVLEDLDKKLHNYKELALRGLGGIGKTTSVAEYAYFYQDKYTAVLWVGDCDKTLTSNFSQLAFLLGYRTTKPNEAEQIAYVQSWLRNNNDWLLIFDNAETPPVLMAAKALIPTNAEGYILYTTRAQVTTPIRDLELGCFDRETGATLLLKRSNYADRDLEELQVRNNVSPDNWQTAQTLSEELGGLALALDQAGAYIEQTECGLQGYLNRFRTDAIKLLNERGGYQITEEHPMSVYKTFALTLELVEKRSPLAGEILRDIADLNAEGISETLYHVTDPDSDLYTDPFELDEALKTLKDYSLINRIPEKELFTTHRLVQVVVKEICDG